MVPGILCPEKIGVFFQRKKWSLGIGDNYLSLSHSRVPLLGVCLTGALSHGHIYKVIQ